MLTDGGEVKVQKIRNRNSANGRKRQESQGQHEDSRSCVLLRVISCGVMCASTLRDKVMFSGVGGEIIHGD